MKRSFVTILVLGGLLLVVGTGVLKSQTSLPNASSTWMATATPTSAGNERHLMSQGTNAFGANQIVLVDSSKQVMAVYWIAPDTGMIQLKSVRNLIADFQLEEFNGTDPSPSKIRSILQPK